MYKQAINDNYVSNYNNGISIWDIANKYNDTYKNVSEAITGHRFEARLLPVEEKCRIVEMYNNGMSTVKIGKMYGLNNKPIAVVLKEFGIDRTGVGRRRYSLDESYFETIDSANKAYIIGFLSADGCNFPNKGTVSMSLEECDKEILEKIRTETNNERPLEFIDYSNKHDFGYTYKNQYRLLMFSRKICDDLNNVGVIPNKSLRLEFSKSIPEEFIPDYIRGVFDGDGSMGVRSLETYTGTISLSITSTYSFCNTLQIILNNLHIESRISDASNNNGITAALYIYKKESMKKFLDWIYKDAELYLKRKHDIYLYHYQIAA